eukprot:s4480_g3.t1
MMREEIRNGMCEIEERVTNKFDAESAKMHEELCAEREARRCLEERMEAIEKKQIAIRTHPEVTQEEVHKSVVVLGGFPEDGLDDALALAEEVLKEAMGFQDVHMAETNANIALATFNSPVAALDFVRRQKRNKGMQSAKLRVSEIRSRSERMRCKIVSKTKKYMIELGGFMPRDIIVSYKFFNVTARVAGKLTLIADVNEACEIMWHDSNGIGPMQDVRRAMEDFQAELE